jgi:hypothetical protein
VTKEERKELSSSYAFVGFFFFFFSSTISENKSVEQVLPRGREIMVPHSGRGEVVGKGDRRVNIVQKLCTHLYKYKNDTC